MIPVGTLVAGYRIRGVLGSGGMGTVYAADDPNLPRVDALKVLPGELSGDPKFRTRFLREAEVAAALDHPNIVTIYDRGETEDGHLWIAMQLVQGTDAQAQLRAGAMTAPRAVHIVSEIAKAVDYSHGRGLLHRDIKPANFLLSGPPGPDERVLLADFGVARLADDVHLTTSSEMVATFAYSAPEILDNREADARSDIYSLGCSLYELLTGHTPFEDAKGVAAQAMAHLRRPPPAVTASCPWLPPAFDAVVATAMAKDPARRYSSAGELAAAARAALHQPAAITRSPQAPAGTPGAGGRTGTPSRKVLLAAGIGAVVLSVAAGAILLGRNSTGPGADGGPTPNGAAPSVAPVTDDMLASLMRSPDQVSAALGATVELKANKYDKLLVDAIGYDAPPLCAGVLFPLQKSNYPTSGVSRVVGQQLKSNESQKDPGQRGSALQAVAAFQSAGEAQDFLTRERAVWPGCADKKVTVREEGGADLVWQILDTGEKDGILTATSLMPPKPGATDTSAGGTCHRALTTRNNVAIDVMTCRPSGGEDAAVTIATAIAAAVPGSS